MEELKYLEKIKPGDIIEWEEHFMGFTSVEEGEVKEVACRCGFDKDGHLVEGYDDYMIVHVHHYPNDDYDVEVGYDKVIRIHKAED